MEQHVFLELELELDLLTAVVSVSGSCHTVCSSSVAPPRLVTQNCSEGLSLVQNVQHRFLDVQWGCGV